MANEKPKKTKVKQMEDNAASTAIVPVFDRIAAMEHIEDSLIQTVMEGLKEFTPIVAMDMLGKATAAHERMINIQRMHRENMESVNGTTRKVVFDCTIIAPREPGDPDAR